ncbi:MAG: TetR/AcrR family transcriptional regulator, partial [Bacillota bacterium]
MAGLRERKKENRKKRIFESALMLFEELGFDKTTMEKIAENADLGVGTLYNYYPSKVELLFSIIDQGIDDYVKELDHVIHNNKNLNDALSEFYHIYLKSFARYKKR